MPTRRARRVRTNRRPTAYRMAPMRRQKMGVRPDNEEGRLLLSNIGPNVTIDMIKEIFCIFGNVGKIVIHTTEDFIQTGTAEVWMSAGTDAVKAKGQLNSTDMFSDGRIIRIERSKLSSKLCKYWRTILKMIGKLSESANKEN
ncbi:unnamed protein product [Medioppia subpectinata]|uniref:RRM domain-containing protein n=1 Tax=Medioppia subpectinata TaxID=1979941 RepID=A0A7R9KHY3_9ACAR|nr:unnamed protein product [Medioppia subpectinata]CAG2102481.1 unnamed protein product [Medioppia subpectinata]